MNDEETLDVTLLPVDPAWAKQVADVAVLAADHLDAMTLVVAFQSPGKMSVAMGGIPNSGPFADLAEDPTALLNFVAHLVEQHDALMKARSAH